MTRQRSILTISCLLLLSASAFGQAAPEPVLTHIPAESMGFIIVPSAQGMTDKIDKFITDIGLGQMMSRPDPDNPDNMTQMSVMTAVKGMLGKDFNPKGGFAVTMLNLKDFGINIMDMMGIPGPDDSDTDTEAKEEPKLPFVIFIPGKSVQGVLGNFNPQQKGKYMEVTLPVGPMLAGQAGSYVMLSPNEKALDAILATKKSAAAVLPAEQLKAINASQIAMVFNGKVAGPVIAELMQMLEPQMAADADEMAPLLNTYFRIYREMLTQLDMVTLAGRFVDNGLVFEELISFQSDTPFGKALAAQKLMGKADLAALPDMPYVMAVSGAASTSQQNVEMGMDIINSLMASEPLSTMPDDLKGSIKKSYVDMMNQITGLQFVGGGPKDAGLFGLSFVIKCKDSAKMKGILADDAQIVQRLIQHFGKDEPEAKDVTVKYVKGIETIGDVSADAIVISSAKIEGMSQEERDNIKTVLGEDKIHFRIASTDKNTVVVTIGGAGTFFAEAVKTAKANSGKIGKDMYAAAAMKHLPANRSMVMLFSTSNLFDLIGAGMKKVEPNGPELPFRITTKTPIAMGVGKTGKSIHMVGFVPTELVKEVTGMAMMWFGGMMGPGGGDAQPPMGGESDF